MESALHGTSQAWDTFYKDWVHPVLNFGTPPLVVFAVLMALAVIVTPMLVGVHTPGIRSGDKGPAQGLRGAYWLGIVCLLFSAVEATIVFPLSRNVPARPEPWAAAVSISLIAAAIIAGVVLLIVVGRERPPLRGLGYCLCAAVLILIILAALGIGLQWHAAWLTGKSAAAIYALVLAALGLGLVARTRGIGIGLLIQGHDKTGADDAGLGAFVRARLYSLGSQEPKGILVAQQTDTSTLPSGALGLIPAGTLAKLAALFVSLFAPPTPWRVDVTEQEDGSIVVSVRRNGRVADATVIRPSTLELPSKQANGGADAADSTAAAGADPSGGDSGGSGAGADWTIELRTAAATFVLLSLSRRYYHLKAGLCGASDWRSVALQVIASDPACQLSAKERHAVLVHAVADDRENKAAELALLSDSYRTARSTDDLTDFATKLERLLDQMPESNEGTLPLRLRSCLNLIVAYVNYAILTAGRPGQAGPRSEACAALTKAKTQVVYLLDFWEKEGMQDKYHVLWQSMYAAVYFAAKSIAAELHRTCCDGEVARIPHVEEGSTLPDGVNMTLLARYEHACCLTRGRMKQGAAKAAEYGQALDELEIAVADPIMLRWARRDPSLAELHDVDLVRQACSTAGEAAVPPDPVKIVARFKDLVGAPVPSDFLSLSPFAPYRDALALRGIHDAARLQRMRDRELRSELSITPGEVARWREVTDLYEMICACQPPGGDGATGAVFLLLQADLDSVSAVCDALKPPEKLRENLLSLARDWAVVAPGEEEVGTWGARLRVPQH
jgi:uncharacterized membrane protein YgcG